jgi:hypothetical protein
MDNIDGKQARRTGTGSPMGEMFDHGCDTLNCPLSGCIQAAAFGLGHSPFALLCILIPCWSMYLSTWEEFHTHTLYLGCAFFLFTSSSRHRLITSPTDTSMGPFHVSPNAQLTSRLADHSSFCSPVEGILIACTILLVSAFKGSFLLLHHSDETVLLTLSL